MIKIVGYIILFFLTLKAHGQQIFIYGDILVSEDSIVYDLDVNHIGKLTNIKYLYLENSMMRDTFKFDEIEQLNNIVVLKIYGYKYIDLEKLFNQLSNIPSLKVLILQNNNILYLPSNIKKISNLSFLALYNNKLSDLPAELDCLENLETLALGINTTHIFKYSNYFKQIPEIIFSLKGLKYLYLHNNLLSRINNKKFAKLKNLKEIGLSGNKMNLKKAKKTLKKLGIEVI